MFYDINEPFAFGFRNSIFILTKDVVCSHMDIQLERMFLHYQRSCLVKASTMSKSLSLYMKAYIGDSTRGMLIIAAHFLLGKNH